MYKTVRHGENSLQYTILPQQEDSSVATGGGLCRSGTRRSARGRTTTVLIITLILACGIVGSAVLVPLLISTDLVALPSALQRFTSSNSKQHVIRIQHVSLGTRKQHHDSNPNTTTAIPPSSTPAFTTSEDNLNTLTTMSNDNKNSSHLKIGEYEIISTKMPSKLLQDKEDVSKGIHGNVSIASKTLLSQSLITHTLTTEQSSAIAASTRPGLATVSDKQVVADGTAITYQTNNNVDHGKGSDKEVYANNVYKNGINSISNNSSTRIAAETWLPGNGDARNESNSSVAVDQRTLNSELASTPNTQVATSPKLARTTNHSKHRSSWLEPRWPFADPSSYFQWTGYNGRDGIVLPLLLAAGTVILLLTVCVFYAMRRRRQKTVRRMTIGRITSDLRRGDKATLLPDGSEEE